MWNYCLLFLLLALWRFSFGSQLSQSDIPRDTHRVVQEDALAEYRPAKTYEWWRKL